MSSKKSSSGYHHAHTTSSNRFHASKRTEGRSSSVQQSSFKMKLLANTQLKKSFGVRASSHLIEDSRRQPRSILPLNMLVSDIAYRKSTVDLPLDINRESPLPDEMNSPGSEFSHLLKIKNRKIRFKPPKCDKFLAMIQEKFTKMYNPHLTQHSGNQSITPLSVLTTPLRQQYNNFSQLYRRRCFNNNDEKTFKRNVNNSITNECFLNPSSQRCYSPVRSGTAVDDVQLNNFVFNPVIDNPGVHFKNFKEIMGDLNESVEGSMDYSCRPALFKMTTVEEMLTFNAFSTPTKKKMYYPEHFIQNEE